MTVAQFWFNGDHYVLTEEEWHEAIEKLDAASGTRGEATMARAEEIVKSLGRKVGDV